MKESQNDEEDEDVYIYKYITEKQNLLVKRKEQLDSRLKQISKDLNESSDLNQFLNEKVNSSDYDPTNLVKFRAPRCLMWFVIKIFGSIFITIYLIGILELIGIMEALKDEIVDSFKFILTTEKKETDFYDNYIKITQIIPDISLFFFSSIFSDIIINMIGYFFTSILVLAANCSIIFFGLINFNFHIGQDLNERYTFKQLLYLIFIYVSYYLFLGLIVLLPHNMLKDSFLTYDWHKIMLKLSKIENKEEGMKYLDNLKISDFPMNGKFFVYLFSIIGSAMCKIYLDRIFVIDSIKQNKFDMHNNKNFIIIIIIISAISIVSSIVFYSLFSCCFCEKTNDDDDDKTSSSVIKIFGYVIYIQSNKLDKSICCHDCRVSMKKCSYCCGCYFCDCCKVCCRINNDVSEANLNKERICITYKIAGLCTWFFNIITDPDMIPFIVLIYFLEITNFGFRLELDKYLEQNEDDTILNYISLSSEIVLYFFNLIFGLSCYGCKIMENIAGILNKKFVNPEYIKSKNETNITRSGLYFLILGGYFISFILSCLMHFNIINDIKYYFIIFSIEICEYTKVIVLYFADSRPEKYELLTKSFQISFYLLFLDILKFVIEIFDTKSETLIFFQFIFGAITFSIFLLILVCFICCLKIFSKEQNENSSSQIDFNQEKKDSSLMINS